MIVVVGGDGGGGDLSDQPLLPLSRRRLACASSNPDGEMVCASECVAGVSDGWQAESQDTDLYDVLQIFDVIPLCFDEFHDNAVHVRQAGTTGGVGNRSCCCLDHLVLEFNDKRLRHLRIASLFVWLFGVAFTLCDVLAAEETAGGEDGRCTS